MSRIVVAFAAALALLWGAVGAQAGVVVVVDKSAQRLTVSVDGRQRYDWAVSTARWGYRTPNGSYRPERLERQWYSRKYDWSPMPHSIFFSGGYAIHGSNEVSRLGRPASHGCIRRHPSNAAVLFALVQGRMSSTRIVVTGDAPMASARAPARYSAGRTQYRPSPRYTVETRRSPRSFADVFDDGYRR
ncbi:MAG: L,D-transpeptidase [Burkholderiaceae bacterium]